MGPSVGRWPRACILIMGVWVFLTTPAQAVLTTATNSGNWQTAGNWDNGVPGADDVAVIPSGKSITLTNATFALAAVTNDGTLGFQTTNAILMASNIYVTGTITHSNNTATATNAAGEWVPDNRIYIVCTNIFIASNGTLNADTRGFGGAPAAVWDGYGPGAGKRTGNSGGGGGYGGAGGAPDTNLGPPEPAGAGATYGLVTAPAEPGSGGANNNAKTAAGGNGGGWVRIDATGVVTVNGAITANGGPFGGSRAGGGSGGAIYITCSIVAATNGSISANGGAGTWDGAGHSGGGGGGRVAISYDTNAQATANLTAKPVLQISANNGSCWHLSQPGTIYLPDSGFFPSENMQGGQVIIPNFVSWAPNSLSISNGRMILTNQFQLSVTNDLTIFVRGGFELTNSALTVGRHLTINGATNDKSFWYGGPAASFTVGSNMSFNLGYLCVSGLTSTVVLSVGGDLAVTNASAFIINNGTTNGGGPDYASLIAVTGDVYIAGNSWVYPFSHPTNGGSALFRMRRMIIATPGSGINADSAGFGTGTASQPGFGPGGGLRYGNQGTGGGYGGNGGWVGTMTGGMAYGSATAPVQPGSAGAANNGGVNAGPGGGLVRIEASSNVTVNGTITANGGGGYAGGGGGGGSGGGINIACTFFAATNGILTANGGSSTVAWGGGYGGGGGGGRIAVTYGLVAQSNLNLTAKPTVFVSAGNGLGAGPADAGTVYMSDAGFYPSETIGGARIVTPGFTSWAPNSLSLTNGRATFPSGFQLTVTNDLTIRGDGGIEITNGVLNVGGNLALNGANSFVQSFLYGGPGSSFTVASNVSLTVGALYFVSGVTNPSTLNIGGNLTITNAGRFYVYAGMTNGPVPDYGARVNVGGTVYLATNSWIYPVSHPTNGGSVLFSVDNLTVAPTNSGFNANGAGFSFGPVTGPGYGPGGGKRGGNWGSGGGYGGAGGPGGGQPGGITYGSTNAPVDAGSGGAVNNNNYGGGAGGGAVRIQAVHTVTLYGTLAANGTDGNGGGGGSGGGIYLTCKKLTGTNAVITANGGSSTINYAGDYGGGGGGGRIAIWRLYDQTNGNWTITATGATNAAAPAKSGLDGTIFWGWLRPAGTIFVVH